jgi:hypothetical protein
MRRGCEVVTDISNLLRSSNANPRSVIETIGFHLDPQYTHTDFGDMGWPFRLSIGVWELLPSLIARKSGLLNCANVTFVDGDE